MFSSSKKTTIRIENFDDLFQIFDDATEMVDQIFRKGFAPSVKIQESKDNYIITLVAPGQSKETFDVSVEKGIITIKADVKEKNDFMESFSKSYRLPGDADSDSIKADYKDGILTIVISKKVDQTSKKVNIS